MGSLVEPLDWETQFLPRFKKEWKPGQHIATIAPTGAGKTTFNVGITDHCRKYVLALDPKGNDSTLSTLGFERLTRWPGIKEMQRRISDNDNSNLPTRYLIGGNNNSLKDNAELKETMRKTLEDAWAMGGWTVLADELRLLTDNRMMNLREQVDRFLIAARDRKLSFISSYQSPAWVSPEASRQASWIAVSYTRDDDIIKRTAEIIGRNRNEVRGAFRGLDKYAFLVVGRDPRQPYMATIPTARN